jgi:hypothetical protein
MINLPWLKKNDAPLPTDITIGITTFEARFRDYFIPLLNRINEIYNGKIEIVVAVNGEHGQAFSESYRKDILEFISQHHNVFPIFFPRFRGLSKLWNSIIIHSTNKYILLLNDDVMLEKKEFLSEICNLLQKNNSGTFLINKSWSHFVANRDQIDELGYFDERLLGIGEEDGDMTWRYLNYYKREVKSFKLKCFLNFSEQTATSHKPLNIKSHADSKYSSFNRKFILEEKYEPLDSGLKGMFDQPVILKCKMEKQYPYETFFHSRKNEL